jgi:transposase
MPQAVPLPVRHQIIAAYQGGATYAAIAQQVPVKERTIRSLCQRLRKRGLSGLKPDYDRCGRPGSRFAPFLKEQALAFKREHRRWGAGFIRLQLAQQFPAEPLPAERTLVTWFQAAGLQPARAQGPPVERGAARVGHAVWQMDAKERMHLADGSPTSTLTVTDEASGAMLETVVFPPVSLESGRGGPGPSSPAAHLPPLGTARAAAGGQRRALGYLGGPALGLGPLADRVGD